MKAKRRGHEPEFKARVALEALKGAKTIQQIAKEYDIHPVQVSDWKKAMTEGMPEGTEDLRINRLLDELYLIDPCLGSRRLVEILWRDHELKVNLKKVQRLRREMGIEAIYCKPRTSVANSGHRKYPYLLRNLAVKHPDQVWCTDITYIPMPRGHAYLCAVMDWHSRKVLGWAVSNTMDTGLCLEALDNALNTTGNIPEIFNTDQGCQFTSAEWTDRLNDLGIKISMDGKGRWMDNVFIER